MFSVAAALGASIALVMAFEMPGSHTVSAQTPVAPDQGSNPDQPTLVTNDGYGTEPATDPAPTPPAAVAADVVYNGPRTNNAVAITLDADLSYWTLDQVQRGLYPVQYNSAALDYLETSGTPATVFVTGLWAQEHPDAMARMASTDLFEIANHTWSHEAWTPSCYRLPYIDDPAVQAEQTRQTSELIAAYTGEYPKFFRFPGLCHDPADVALVADQGMLTVDTDVAAGDAFVKDPAQAAYDIASRVQPGSIIVMHLNGAPNAAHTAAILEQLVPQLRARGLEPMTLADLLAR